MPHKTHTTSRMADCWHRCYIILHCHWPQHTDLHWPQHTDFHCHWPQHTDLHCHWPQHTDLHCHWPQHTEPNTLGKFWYRGLTVSNSYWPQCAAPGRLCWEVPVLSHCQESWSDPHRHLQRHGNAPPSPRWSAGWCNWHTVVGSLTRHADTQQ